MAYAYNGYNSEIINLLKSLGVTYARTTEESHSFEVPENWLTLKPTCHHADPKLGELTDRFLNQSPEDEFKHREPWLFYVLSENKDIWFASNGEIYDYVQAYNRLVFSLDGERVYNPSCIPVFIELRGRVYEIPCGKEISFDK